MAVGISTGTACAALAYMQYNQRQMGLPALGILREALLPSMLAYPMAVLAMAVCRSLPFAPVDRLTSLAWLALAAAIYLLSLAWTYWRLVLSDAEKQKIAGHLPIALPRRLSNISSRIA